MQRLGARPAPRPGFQRAWIKILTDQKRLQEEDNGHEADIKELDSPSTITRSRRGLGCRRCRMAARGDCQRRLLSRWSLTPPLVNRAIHMANCHQAAVYLTAFFAIAALLSGIASATYWFRASKSTIAQDANALWTLFKG